MSTKTLRKRIALVAVAALGFGLVSGTPAQAAGWTSGLTLSHTALTVVGTTETADATKAFGFFYVDTTNLNGTTSTAAPLEANESIQATVTAAPTGQAATDLKITSVTNVGTAVTSPFADSSINGDGDSDATVTAANDKDSVNSSFSETDTKNNESNRYWFAVSTDTASAIGSGKYTIRLRLTNTNTAGAEVKDYTFTVKFVASIADAGAVLTLTKTGTITTGAPYATTVNTAVTATLRDADSGRIQLGQAITGTRQGWAPVLNANMMASTTVGEALAVVDTGYTGRDYVNCGTGGAAACGTTPTGGIAQTLSQAMLAAGDGTYGVYLASGTIAATASSTAAVRVRVTSTAVSTSITVPVIAAQTAEVEDTDVLLTATGISIANQLYRDVTNVSGTATLAYTLPLGATTAKLTVDTDAANAGEAFTATTTWSGSYASAAVTPASENEATVYTDASGKFVIDIANTTPVASGSVSVKLIGFDDVTHSLTITLTWAKAAIDLLTVTDPTSGVYAKTKSATTFTVLATDQFGNPLAGEQIIPSLSDTSANYSATTTYAPVTTGAAGTATWTLTDAAATDTVGDAITFTSVTNSGETATYSLTYKATLPAAATLTGFRSSTLQNVAEGITERGTSISSTSGLTGTLSISKNISKDMSAFADVTDLGDDMYAVRIRAVTSTGAAATGAPVTLTASTGGWVQDSTGLPATSRTRSVNSSGDVYFRILATATGTLTFTATSGTASFAFPVTIADQSNAAGRFVSITGATTGTANGAGVPVTVAVTDRFGNGVANVTLVVTASGAGAFMGGQTSQSFTTDATGKYTFLATSYTAAGGSATYSANATNATDASSIAGYSGTNVIDSTVKAGNKAASVTITFAEGTNAAEANAQGALDAAAEATDAANAATDAANAAAEAADAATAAAQDAADAVAALSTQVGEMIDALKKQITALTNLVIKIQKKVKA